MLEKAASAKRCHEVAAPAALPPHSQDQSLTYSLYSVPNMVLPLFGGILIDRVGVQTMTMVVVSLVLAGQVIVALGSAMHNFNLILVGRIVFGIGGETMSVAQVKVLVKWFDMSELAFVFGLSNSFSTFSAVLNYKWSPWIADHYDVTTALWVGAGVCGLSFVAALLLVQIDKKLHIASEKSEAASIRDLKLLGWLFWLLALQSLVNSCIGPFNNTATSVFLERDYFQQPPPLCQRCGLGYYNVYCDAVSPHCPNVPPFAWPLPLLSKNCSITSPFDQFQCSKAPPYILDEDINCDDVAWREGPFTHRYCATKSQAAETATSSLSYNPMVQTGLAPLAGWLVDLFGRRPMISVVAEIGVAVAHAAINYSQVTVTVPLLLLGVSQCFLQASMGSAFPLVVPPRAIGTAYGFLAMVGNMGAAVTPLVVAALYAHYDRYIPHVQVLFVGFGVANALLGVALVAMDRAHHGVLSRFSPPRDMDLDHKEPFLE
ncbi:hypothetical protein, variant 2 [Aphanomyces astaci]|uniref:Lysosomal dipeptide transporter MFSD1 n=1 Tax=Aphanomyces astaci TaxID=112090 RepID=W4H0M7_APHAT|nr:hypothetical protein, variant 2 [Aphanomyces astaci]ETV85111.1 hypothetical protein, variant 2 [Aphanomyces astaci]|eukprot:XP_009825129.1 hypothetical protein, variant 2 [Aphanomyces astaci]